MKKIIISIAAILTSIVSVAQTGTNSPYSQFGFGELTGEVSGFNNAMNGVGIGFSEGNQVNYLNPASYSSLDSLTFIFDMGMSLQMTNFEENGKRRNANNAKFDYAVAGLRLAKKLGLSFGLVPFTQIGYNFSTLSTIGTSQSKLEYAKTYQGSGGLRQVYLGLGYEPIKNLSIGVNAAYVWGEYSHILANTYSDNTVNAITMTNSADINTYKIDFGLQYKAQITKKDNVTIGLTYGLGHKIGNDPTCVLSSVNNSTNTTNVDNYNIDGGLKLPHMFGAGLMWLHGNMWKVGVDYTQQQWADTGFPILISTDNSQQFVMNDNYFMNRHRIVLGGEYCRNRQSRNFFQRIRYRAGAGYATPYYKVGSNDGPKEYSVSAGFGIPIANGYNNRSILNISGQWVRQQAAGMLKENTFRICVGLTFNERWFQKWKFE